MVNNFIELWCLVASGGVEICVSLTSFQKNDITWPQQPLTERVSDISKRLDFWWSIPQKGTSIGHCYQVNDCSSKILLIKGGMYYLRHCHPSIDKISFINKRRNVLVFSMKNTVLLLLIKIFYIIKGGTYWFSV